MGLLNTITIETEAGGADIEQVYFRIPRSPDDGFFDQHGRKHINVTLELWTSYATREEVTNGKKPFKKIELRFVDATHEEVFGTPAVPAQFDGEGNRIAEAIPAKEGVRNAVSDTMFTAPYTDAIDDEEIDQYVIDHCMDIENGERIGRYEAMARAYVAQMYTYIKTVDNLCGMDMTTAIDQP